MPSLIVPNDIKNLDLFLQNQIPAVQRAIQHELPKGLDKFYTARLLDLYIKKTNKILEQVELSMEALLPGVEPTNIDTVIRALASGEIKKSYNEFNQLFAMVTSSDRRLVSNEGMHLIDALQQGADVALRSKKTLEHRLTAARAAREALSLSPNEEAKVYLNIKSVYAEQVRNRKWYQHDAVKIISLILFPILFPLYFLWKSHREAENIQCNEHNLTDKRISRKSRQHFKQHVNTINGRQNTFFTGKNFGNDSGAEPPPYLTKHKKARNEFFREHKEWFFGTKSVKNSDIDWVLKSKEDDDNLRLSLGIK